MRGFTLVEVLLALAILLVAGVGSARLFSLAVVMTGRARVQTSATALAMQKLDELRALRWTVVAGAPAVSSSDTHTSLAAASPTAGGAGLSLSPADSLDRDEPGYVDYLDRDGQWLGTGAAPPRGTVFVRRWNVTGRAGDSANTLVLRVLVTSLAGDRTQPGGGARVRRPGDALLAAVRTRVTP